MTTPLIREHDLSADRIADAVTARLAASGLADVDPLRDALVHVFARYCETLVDRLNRVPETHHLGFLGLLGAAPRPPVSAIVPLTFKAVRGPGRAESPLVPLHTQVAAPGTGDDKEPVVFETMADLELVRADLLRAIAVDVRSHRLADVGEMVSAAGLPGPTLFAQATPMTRAVHFEQRAILGLPNLTELRLKVELDHAGVPPSDWTIDWGIASEKGFAPLVPESDTTHGLSGSGEVVFRNLPKWPATSILGTTSNWLTCRARPVGPAAASIVGRGPAWQPPRIARIGFSAASATKPAPIDSASWGLVPLDVSRDFYPLGERPRFGEVFHIQSQSFTLAGARIALQIKLTNPAGTTESPIPPVSREGKPRLAWEIHTERGWVGLSASDGTGSLVQDGEVVFTIPSDASPTAMRGVTGGWIRARLVSGAYAARTQAASAAGEAMTPPSIAAMTVSTSIQLGPSAPERVLIEGNLEYTDPGGAATGMFQPFPSDDSQALILYLGLAAAATELANRTLSFYVHPAEPEGPVFYRDLADDGASAPRWQVRGATGWRDCSVVDHTQGMRQPGIIEVRTGDDVCQWRSTTLDPEQKLSWLRIVWDAPLTDEPCLRRLVLNAVPAIQAITLERELLGSSTGRPDQVFHTARASIVGAVDLEVREPGGAVRAGQGETLVPGAGESWVRWARVDDFTGSDSQSRHFTLDPLTGTVRFGDGKHGCIPPSGANNIRMREYHTGGGRRGNKPELTITQLRTTIPYVESVTNAEPATGGQDTEDHDALRRSAGFRLRHRDRAVCAEDYADLARQASSVVAKAICVPARDLARDPTAQDAAPGVVSLLIVPHSSAARPQPAFDLMRQVKTHLDARRPVGVELVILGPEYASVGVEADIVVAPGRSAAAIARACESRLTDFLHPVTGGPDGAGWGFGQRPHASDFYPLLGAVDGVDHIRLLQVHIDEDRPGTLASGRFVVSAGAQQVRAS
jgi:predicted phage baseplate assembly protein